ncbi:MAG TPA: hypothetical protein H9768_10215 [Candidatus Mailhella merdavium]|nr:hypothetical protein [Candidatus Mailhella merdavium]
MEKPSSSLPHFMNKSGVARDSANPSPEGKKAAQPEGRNAYQQRVDQLKIRIAELSQRNMENTLRILRTWMKER